MTDFKILCRNRYTINGYGVKNTKIYGGLKLKIRVCDLCGEVSPDAKIKYKYKAKHYWCSWYEGGWEKIELCNDCIEKIIKAGGLKNGKRRQS